MNKECIHNFKIIGDTFKACSKCYFICGVKATNDDQPLTSLSHPRNTILGASLLLERLFPEISKAEINRAAPLLANEFNQIMSK